MCLTAALLCLLFNRTAFAGDDAATRAENILGQMTLDEKIAYMGGNRIYIRAVPRLNLPAIKVSDGPVGVRTTAYTAGICLAASWDRDLAARLGTALGREGRARGVHILLGPALNIYRTPRCGRNFEYMGEDPYLAGQLAVAEIKALQAEGVLATVKHFACNNQESDRDTVDARVDERTLREIYLPAFQAAIQEGGAQGVMDAYNKLNGVYCAHNAFLNIQILRKEWGFTGIVMSDWGGAHDGLAAATGGLDLEMPKAVNMTKDRLLGDIASGALDTKVIDEHVRHILRTIIAAGFLDRPQEIKGVHYNDPACVATALDEARAGIVLLKNEGAVLPLDSARIRRIAVIGPNAHPAVTGGGGSSWMEPSRVVSVFDGIRQVQGISATFVVGKPDGDRAEAVAAARDADAAVVCVGFNKDLEGEGGDREYGLPAGQADLIKAVAAANPRTVVVLFAGGGVDWDGWLDQVPMLVHAWYPGQEGGRAIADILFGAVNPSGKLPATFERRARDNPCAPYYQRDAEAGRAVYGEGIFVGYRGYDRNSIEPQFCFGYGLSYTSFEYFDLSVTPETAGNEPMLVAFTVKNTGSREGAEVAQVYVGQKAASVPRPIRELKGFVKITLNPGEFRRVTVVLPRAAFSFWHPEKKAWVVEPGAFTISVGASSRDLRLAATAVRGN
jgi:beta-glucosidase